MNTNNELHHHISKIAYPSVLFECDPDKNDKCTKEGCTWPPSQFGLCHMTTHREYAMTDEDGNPIIIPLNESGCPIERSNEG